MIKNEKRHVSEKCAEILSKASQEIKNIGNNPLTSSLVVMLSGIGLSLSMDSPLYYINILDNINKQAKIMIKQSSEEVLEALKQLKSENPKAFKDAVQSDPEVLKKLSKHQIEELIRG